MNKSGLAVTSLIFILVLPFSSIASELEENKMLELGELLLKFPLPLA